MQLPGANPFYGYTKIGGVSYLVRERSPYKESIELEELKKYGDFRKYVRACGQALAFCHRSVRQGAEKSVSKYRKGHFTFGQSRNLFDRHRWFCFANGCAGGVGLGLFL